MQHRIRSITCTTRTAKEQSILTLRSSHGFTENADAVFRHCLKKCSGRDTSGFLTWRRVLAIYPMDVLSAACAQSHCTPIPSKLSRTTRLSRGPQVVLPSEPGTVTAQPVQYCTFYVPPQIDPSQGYLNTPFHLPADHVLLHRSQLPNSEAVTLLIK
jgi:hypothetical protein